MTPFDPVALVAMLTVFYPIVSVENLQRARAERPEYFAGGVLFGSKGDKLRLPDGRVFDLIFAAGGPASGRRWQALDVTDDAAGGDDPFALEEGPLVPLDDSAVTIPRSDPAFTALVAGELAALEHDDSILAAAAQPVIEFTGADDLDHAFGEFIDPADEAHGGTLAALDSDPITDVLESSAGGAAVVDSMSGEYTEDPPPDTPEPDPGDPPGDDGGKEPPPPI